MKIEINIEKKYFLALFAFMLVLTIMVGAVAYTANFPTQKKNIAQAKEFGHSADEIVVDEPIDTDLDGIGDQTNLMTLQDWIALNKKPKFNCFEISGPKVGVTPNNINIFERDLESTPKKVGQAWCEEVSAGSLCTATVDTTGSGNKVGTCNAKANDFGNDDTIYCCALS